MIEKEIVTGCKNWMPTKCLRCGAYWGASACFEPIKGTRREIMNFYEKQKEKEKLENEKIQKSKNVFTKKMEM